MNPALDHVRDAERDDPSLARARAGQDQHRTYYGLGGLALLRIERTEIQHAARILVRVKMMASGLPIHDWQAVRL